MVGKSNTINSTNIINIKTDSSYNIYIGNNFINNNKLDQSSLELECKKLFNKNYGHIVVIVDSNVNHNIGEFFNDIIIKSDNNKNINIDFVSINISESKKTRASKEHIENKLFELNCGRDSFVIAVGGGVLLDLVGFVAATYKRGLPVFYIATSLLAMVDASVGGKTGVNTKFGKNTIGAFKQPDAVFIDTKFLSTLPDVEYKSALSEVIKTACIFSEELFEILERDYKKIIKKDCETLSNIIQQSVKIKAEIVSQDEHEAGIRELLNFGHTIGHAIEKNQNYNISHGQAVALGIWVESELAYVLNILSESDLNRIHGLLELYYRSSIVLDNKLLTSKLLNSNNFNLALLSDKKNKNNKVHYVLINKVGGYYSVNNKFSFSLDSLNSSDSFDLSKNLSSNTKNIKTPDLSDLSDLSDLDNNFFVNLIENCSLLKT